MRILRVLLVLALCLGVVAGTAGLFSPRRDSDCGPSHWQLDDGSGRDFAQPLSLWPPGGRCQLVEADGTVVDEDEMPVTGFLALLALWAGLLALVLRSRRPPPLPLRMAVVASVGLLVWGVLSLEFGALAGAGISVLYLFAPLVGFAVDRRLRRAGGDPARRTDGVLGLFVAPAAIVVGLFGWLLVSGPISAAVTVALSASAAAVVDWCARRFALRRTRLA